MLPLPPVAEVVERVLGDDAHAVYPYVFYVAGTSHSDLPHGIRVATWVIPLGDRGLVVHSVGDGDVAIVRAYRRSGATVVEDDSLVPELVDTVIEAVRRVDLRVAGLSATNRHVAHGVAELLGLDADAVTEVLREARARALLEGRTAVIFGDRAFLLSKRDFIKPLSFDPEVVRRYAVVPKSPVSYIAEELVPAVLGRRVAFIVFEEASVACNERTCYPVPLPRGIVLDIAKKCRATVVDVTGKGADAYRGADLPVPLVAVGAGYIYLLEKRGDELAVVERKPLPGGPSVLHVFSPGGFLGYGVLARGTVRVERAEDRVKRAGDAWLRGVYGLADGVIRRLPARDEQEGRNVFNAIILVAGLAVAAAMPVVYSNPVLAVAGSVFLVFVLLHSFSLVVSGGHDSSRRDLA